MILSVFFVFEEVCLLYIFVVNCIIFFYYGLYVVFLYFVFDKIMIKWYERERKIEREGEG